MKEGGGGENAKGELNGNSWEINVVWTEMASLLRLAQEQVPLSTVMRLRSSRPWVSPIQSRWVVVIQI